jgi:type IV secretory pathway VirB2 component (pilin)
MSNILHQFTATFSRFSAFHLLMAASITLLLLPEPSYAAQTSVLPWDNALTALKDSLTGPVALAIALIGTVIAGSMLIFGGEMGDFGRRMVMLVFVVALIGMAGNLLTSLFEGADVGGAGGIKDFQAAVIGDVEPQALQALQMNEATIQE